MAETASLGELLARLDQFIVGKLNMSLPATIVAYNPATQTATVQIVPAARYHDDATDAWIPEIIPPIGNVPVLFPSGGGGAYTITWPLVPGDPVLLVICDRSTDEYRSTGAPQTVPQDVRRFDLTDAVALPGYHPPVRPIPPTGHNPSALVLQAPLTLIGSSAAVDPPVTEARLQAFLAELKLWLDLHTHPTPGGASLTPTPPLSPAAGPLGALKIRVE